MKVKKVGVFLTVILSIAILTILFFIGTTYHWASTTEIKDNVDYIAEVPISDVEAIAKEQENGITKQDAEKLCQKILGDKAEENGFPISYRCISAVSANNKLYYVMHIAWLVNNNHWSYIGNCYISSDGQEIYDGIVSQSEYTMTELRWKK